MATSIRNRFYPLLALVLAALVFVGFSRSYYLRPWFDRPPLNLLLQLHGLVFTAWMVLFYVQTRLIAAHRVSTHMKLGIAGAALTVVIAVLTYMTALQGGRGDKILLGLTPLEFMALPMVGNAIFIGLVAAAIALRGRPEYHKRLMVLATISILGPALGRMSQMLFGSTVFAFTVGMTFVLLAWSIVNDYRKYRLVHPVYLVGGSLLLISWPLRRVLAQTDGWLAIARWMAGSL
jgi:hypothetical protein